MADIVWADVTGMFPGDTVLASVPVAAQTNILAYVNGDLSSAYFATDSTFKLARIYMAAHMATVGSRAGAVTSGPLQSATSGNVSMTYANVTQAAFYTSTTSYGELYNGLLQSQPGRIVNRTWG